MNARQKTLRLDEPQGEGILLGDVFEQAEAQRLENEVTAALREEDRGTLRLDATDALDGEALELAVEHKFAEVQAEAGAKEEEEEQEEAQEDYGEPPPENIEWNALDRREEKVDLDGRRSGVDGDAEADGEEKEQGARMNMLGFLMGFQQYDDTSRPPNTRRLHPRFNELTYGKEAQEVLDLAMQGRSVFVDSYGFTGCTTLLLEVANRLGSARNLKVAVLDANPELAQLNGVWSVEEFFGVLDINNMEVMTAELMVSVNEVVKKRLAEYERGAIIIDNVQMLSHRAITNISAILLKCIVSGGRLSFAGVQMIVGGNFYAHGHQGIAEEAKRQGASHVPVPVYAFQSLLWYTKFRHVVSLKKQIEQDDGQDPRFASMLRRVARSGWSDLTKTLWRGGVLVEQQPAGKESKSAEALEAELKKQEADRALLQVADEDLVAMDAKKALDEMTREERIKEQIEQLTAATAYYSRQLAEAPLHVYPTAAAALEHNQKEIARLQSSGQMIMGMATFVDPIPVHRNVPEDQRTIKNQLELWKLMVLQKLPFRSAIFYAPGTIVFAAADIGNRDTDLYVPSGRRGIVVRVSPRSQLPHVLFEGLEKAIEMRPYQWKYTSKIGDLCIRQLPLSLGFAVPLIRLPTLDISLVPRVIANGRLIHVLGDLYSVGCRVRERHRFVVDHLEECFQLRLDETLMEYLPV